MECPPRHTPYASRALANGAVTLHLMGFPNCPGYNAWGCGDHFHVGHRSKPAGDACKTNPLHRALKRRLRSVYRTRRSPRHPSPR